MRPGGPVVSRIGFTTIELLVVLAVVGVLASIAAPAASSALTRALGNEAAEQVESLVAEAARRARDGVATDSAVDAAHWGVALVQEAGGPAYVTLLYGSTGADEYAPAGEPQRVALPQTVRVQVAQDSGLAVPLDGRLAWFHRYLDGRPIRDPGTRSPIDIGLPGSPLATLLYLENADSGRIFDLALYRIGVLTVSER
jgi:prepilin-type N-terminal cleavage/methylation domain-containing protein